MRQGGRYTVDPKTGESTLVARTGLKGQQQKPDEAQTQAPQNITEEADNGAQVPQADTAG